MMFRARGLAAGAVVSAAALLLASCGSDSGSDNESAAAGASGGTYSVGFEKPAGLTPSNATDLYATNIIRTLFTGLYTFQTEGASMKTVPTELLKSVTASADSKTYTIEINPGNKFTNGEEVTAQTFVDTWNFAANGGNAQQLGSVFGPSQLNIVGYEEVSDTKSTDGEMSGLKVVNPTTFEVTLVAPIGKPLFENYVAGPQVRPMPSVAFEDVAAFDKHPIGNGPYMMPEPWSQTGASVVRNPDYNMTPGKADAIDFRFYTDTNALWADLQADNLDVTYNLPQQALSTAPAVLGDRFINQTGMSFSFEAFPTQIEAFQNRDVRVALAKAVNWAEISEKVYFNTRVPATGFGPSTIPGGGRDICGEDCTYDPAAAKALLDGAGGIPGNKVQVVGLANSPNLGPTAQCNMIQESLGVECTVRTFESFGDQLDAFLKLNADDEGMLVGLGWGADNPTLANMIAPLFATGASSNYFGYSNAEFDKLIAEGNSSSDEATAIAKWQEAEEVLYEEFAGHATQWRNITGGYSTKVSNVEIDPSGLINLNEITVNAAG